MISIGVKLTHDASVAAVEDGKLLFSIELEKLNNNPRYCEAASIAQIEDVLRAENITYVDNIIVDGWKTGLVKKLGSKVAPYTHSEFGMKELDISDSDVVVLGKNTKSIQHMTSHIIAACSTSPYPIDYCIVWDGGVLPRLYQICGTNVIFIKQLGKMTGAIYGIMGLYAGPFKKELHGLPTVEDKMYAGRDVPGKLMSWIGHGSPVVVELASRLYDEMVTQEDDYVQRIPIIEHEYMRKLLQMADGVKPEDILASIHNMLGFKLLDEIVKEIPRGSNISFTGGSALNIKWNSMLRSSGHFANIWIPPMPNDSGNAIGCAFYPEWIAGNPHLEWGIYSGPKLIENGGVVAGWKVSDCSMRDLAKVLFDNQHRPVLLLKGRAEIGPRALGHRSIIMSARSFNGKDVLNKIKGRESWRPVAPVATANFANTAFIPGTEDKYMLFDHIVLHKELFPAISHVDGTARLQTVSADDDIDLYTLLVEYGKLDGGHEMLCNTSANLNGSGFFNSTSSAMEWGKVDHIWADGNLYVRKE